jgi:hypothetical protein
LHESISSGFAGVHELSSGVVILNFLDISLNFGVVEEKVLFNSGFVDSFSPGNDSVDFRHYRFAGSELSREGLDKSHNVLNGSRPVLGLGISKELSEVRLERCSTIEALLNLVELVLLNEAFKKSGNESSSRFGSNGRKSALGRVDRSSDLHESISCSSSRVHVFSSGEVGFNFLNVSLNLSVVEEEVLLNSGLVDSTSPGDDMSDIRFDSFTGRKLGREGLGDLHELGNSIFPLGVSSISKSFDEVRFERLGTIVALLNFIELVILNKSVEESSNESSNSLGSRESGNGRVDGSSNELKGIGSGFTGIHVFSSVEISLDLSHVSHNFGVV